MVRDTKRCAASSEGVDVVEGHELRAVSRAAALPPHGTYLVGWVDMHSLNAAWSNTVGHIT